MPLQRTHALLILGRIRICCNPRAVNASGVDCVKVGWSLDAKMNVGDCDSSVGSGGIDTK